MTTRPRGPVVFDREDASTPPPDPAAAPPVRDADAPMPEGRAMQIAARLGARPMSGPARLFWSAAVAFAAFVLSLALWDYVTGLLARVPLLGGAAALLAGLAALGALLLVLRELVALRRLRRVDTLRGQAEAALSGDDAAAARAVVAALDRLYAPRRELAAGRARLSARGAEVFDANGLIEMAERDLLAPLDAAARLEIELAARQVATATALVPMPLADVVAALLANLRMIRRIAELYGGLAGTIGSWRLTRAVLAHLLATGLLAAGDDLVSSVAGGGILSKVSRRFGEGVVNGALTARVGIAAMELCRPLPFRALPAPRVTRLVQRALTGLFDRGERGAPAPD